jgi:hypothetical protein
VPGDVRVVARALTALHTLVFMPEAGRPRGTTKTVSGPYLLWITVVDDDLIEGRVRGEPHFGVPGQSTQALLKLRVQRGGFPRLSAFPAGNVDDLKARVRGEGTVQPRVAKPGRSAHDLRQLTPVGDERLDLLHRHLKDVDERDRVSACRLDVFTGGRHTASSSQLPKVSGHRVVLSGVGAVSRVGIKIALQ